MQQGLNIRLPRGVTAAQMERRIEALRENGLLRAEPAPLRGSSSIGREGFQGPLALTTPDRLM